MEKKDLLGMALAELEAEMPKLGGKKFSAKQIMKWIYSKSARDINLMTDLSVELRKNLAESWRVGSLETVNVKKSETANKYILRCADGNRIESVLMFFGTRNTICLSTQVGCCYGCEFCYTGKMGFKRHLTVSEILDQINLVRTEAGIKINNIVFMGMGEPLANYDNTVKSIRLINASEGFNIGARHITLSTVGLADKLTKLIKEGLNINISISLNAPNDDVRRRIMPAAMVFEMKELLDASRKYQAATAADVTLEYVMIKNVNDTIECLEEFIKKARGFKVNLITLNKSSACEWEPSSEHRIHIWLKRMSEAKLIGTVRRSAGAELNAACGQLGSGK